jgi:hypothetical protein
MTYNINKTNGELLTAVPDGEVDISSSIRLVGRNYPGYGEIMGENLVAMLEHFSNDTPPPNPIVGQLWHNIKENTIYFFDNTNTWLALEAFDTSTRPHMLKVIDTAEVSHTVLGIYASNTLVAIISGDATFVPIRDRENLLAGVTIESFPQIKPGINLNVNPANVNPFRMVGYMSEAEMIAAINTALTTVNQTIAAVKVTADEALRLASLAGPSGPTGISTENWVISEIDGNLHFSYKGVNKLILGSDGNITAAGSVASGGTI